MTLLYDGAMGKQKKYIGYINMRASREDRERLSRVSRVMNMSASDTIRALLRFIDRNPDFSRLLKSGDNR